MQGGTKSDMIDPNYKHVEALSTEVSDERPSIQNKSDKRQREVNEYIAMS